MGSYGESVWLDLHKTYLWSFTAHNPGVASESQISQSS